jgi:membrane protein DedA with SNARE-associated domain
MWMIPRFWLIALATLISEDLTCLATGMLVAQGQIGILEGTLACVAGIFIGDMGLFVTGRFAGGRPFVHRWLPEDKLATAARWLTEHGLKVVLLSRFTPGLRLPTYVAAGVARSHIWAFAGYFLLSSLLWTPLLVGGSAIFGQQVLSRIFNGYNLFISAAAALGLFGLSKLHDFETRRRAFGFVLRILRWEFWPSWAAYAPLTPYFAFLAIRHRSLTVFTAANPGLYSGGLKGESKSQTLRLLSRVPGAVAPFELVAPRAPHPVETFPIVLKPDTGERGTGVMIARSQTEVDDYLARADAPVIAQQYVSGCEFGVYYVRYPFQAAGRVLSVTIKKFPSVVGDGSRTLRRLILDDPRAVCMAAAYFRVAKRDLSDVPARGEAVQLVEIGSHCRGTIFLDGAHLITPELAEAIDRVSRAHPGFFIGRYDVRAASEQALSQSQFTVIELNGVGAEATHVYDPAVSLIEAYRVMARHWRMAFEIGAMNHSCGAPAMTVRELIALATGIRLPFPFAAKLPAASTSRAR